MQLFAFGGNSDQWNALALSDLNMNGFSINNINTITLSQTAITGCGAQFHRNLPLSSTDSPIVCIWNEHIGDDQPSLRIIHAQVGGNAIFINGGNIDMTTVATSKLILPSIDDSTHPTFAFGDGDTGFYEHADDEMYWASSGIVRIKCTGAYIYSGSGQSWALRNVAASATIPAFTFTSDEDTGIGRAGVNQLSLIAGGTEGVRINANNTAASVVILTNIGTGTSLELNHNGATGAAISVTSISSGFGLSVARNNVAAITSCVNFTGTIPSNAASTVGSEINFVYIHPDGDNGGVNSNVVGINNDYNYPSLFIDHDDTGTTSSFYIDRDGNNAADIWAQKIDCDNAGAGVPGGIDMTSFTAGEALLGIPVDAAAIGNTYGRMAVFVNGVGIKYLDVYDAPV